MIRIFTKTRHVTKIRTYLDENGLPYEIYTRFNELPIDNNFKLGVSYCWSRKIRDLTRPWVNYHTAPLPAYPGGDPYTEGVKDRVLQWGCTVHYMNEKYDEGPIIKRLNFKLHDAPKTREELAALAHYFNFIHFKNTIKEIYEMILEGLPNTKVVFPRSNS